MNSCHYSLSSTHKLMSSCFWFTKCRSLHTALATQLSDTKSIRFELGFVRSTWKWLSFFFSPPEDTQVFCHIYSSRLEHSYPLFEGAQFLHRQGQTVQKESTYCVPCPWRWRYDPFERSVNIYELTLYYDAVDYDIQLRDCENIKSLSLSLVCNFSQIF